MNAFWLTANLAGAELKTMVNSKRVDEMVAGWEQAAVNLKLADVRSSTRAVVVEALETNRHHTEKSVAEMTANAMLWLVVTGPLGPRLLPLLHEGGPNMKVHFEITALGEAESGKPAYNFRTVVDEATSARMGS